MINLISSSPTRAILLQEACIKFNQIPFEFDESYIPKIAPQSYSYNVVKAKFEQFKATNKTLDNLLFADSSVVCKGEILGKASSLSQAANMLNLQSNSEVSVITSMIFSSSKLSLHDISITRYKFDKFEENDMRIYLESLLWRGKAGAMMIEGFNKKYILQSHGHSCTARGLNVEILKAFL